MSKLLLVLALFGLSRAFVCPGTIYTCPGPHGTCCPNVFGIYCCPYSNASCCVLQDKCCPSGKTCDLSSGKCLSSNGDSVEGMLKQLVPQNELAQNISVIGKHLCPDHRQTCPGGYTCCQLSNEDYSCCPFQNGVCCADRLHCCPEGHTCDLEQQRCNQKLTSMSKSEKNDMNSVNGFCPDHSYCHGSSTCCPTVGKRWRCCPMAAATCCPDLQHCCPHGTICTSGGFCVRQVGQNAIPYIFKLQ